MEELQEINIQAALKSSKALAKLIGKHVVVEIPGAELKSIEEVASAIRFKEIVAWIYLPVTGGINGGCLLMFPEKATFTLSDLLIKKKPGTTKILTELDKDALKELGNIICGNYFTVLSNALQVKIIEHIPQFRFGVFGATAEQIVREFAQGIEKLLVVKLRLVFTEKAIEGYFVMLFEAKQIDAALSSLKK